MSGLQVRVLTPKGEERLPECDSLHLNLAPDANGRGEGSIGIRRGHVPALIALAPGRAEAFLGGIPVWSGELGRGVASVRNDVVTITVEKIKKKGK